MSWDFRSPRGERHYQWHKERVEEEEENGNVTVSPKLKELTGEAPGLRAPVGGEVWS